MASQALVRLGMSADPTAQDPWLRGKSVEPLGVVSETKNHPKMLGCQEAVNAHFPRGGPVGLSFKGL